MPFRRAELSSSLPNAFLAAFRAADALGNPSKIPLPYHQPTDVITCPPPHAVCQLVEHINVNIERFVEEEENLAIFNEVTLCATTEARLCLPEQQIDKEDLVAPHHAWA
ncbi:hypothetical protein FA10DRAFT_267893 [Acaromyces ingoldii]|uniref:Uncharacterized protein n=1 Tax=Acaromyces ingoldii TaxID=215250 RepID=A0A316YMN0_9BASI|nr:hypothetical protein FA10DRAFT_267893 [Acaromyces ingoldii]PWN89323.1 hypothetical protein FA10DRAFT_267893 [Acaromyces ingoldii]